MTPTRREFIKGVGIALASLVAVRCVPSAGEGDSPRDRLRVCWQRLDRLAEMARDWDHQEQGEKARDELVADHRAALDELVAAGELDGAIADQVQEGFAAAAYHVWRANCGMGCYLHTLLLDYTPPSAGQLVQQANLLADMAAEGEVDPATVARVRAAIERDIAFLGLSDEETRMLHDEMTEGTNIPPAFDELELEVTPEAAAAARFLVELLLGETE